MRRFFKTYGLGLFIFAVTIAYCMYMGGVHGFGARCARVYNENTAVYERCVARVSEGGPVFEENIGKM